METLKIGDVLISTETSIKEAMRNIDHSGQRVVYVADETGCLAGAVSDSEIRKAILKGFDIFSPVKDIVYKDPIVLRETDLLDNHTVRSRIKELLDKMPGNEYIVVLEKSGRPKELLAIKDVLGAADRSKTEKIKQSYVLVVGGAGYLGSVLVRKLLAQGYKVRILDLLLFGKGPVLELLKDSSFDLVEGDMRNIPTIASALIDVSAVINLAAIVGDPACKSRPEATIETNYLANKVLAEACKYNQINRFIYASTCSVYGRMENSNFLTEESPLNPVSLYARSKIQSEIGILSLEDENFSPTILRMSTLYGFSPRMRFDLVLNTMTKTAVVEEKIIVNGGGKQRRPLLSVDDAAEAYIKCLESPLTKVKGQIYNVGSQRHNYRVIEIAQQVKAQIPKAEIVVEGETKDLRDYSVSFDKIESQLDFRANSIPKESVKIIAGAIKNGSLKDINDPRFYNQEYNQ